MKKKEEHPRQWNPSDPSNDPDQATGQNGLAGWISTLNFVVVIIFLGAWITAFILIYQTLSASGLSANILTNLSCISFFGGLIIAFLIGAMTNNLLRRFLWKFPFFRRSIFKD